MSAVGQDGTPNSFFTWQITQPSVSVVLIRCLQWLSYKLTEPEVRILN